MTELVTKTSSVDKQDGNEDDDDEPEFNISSLRRNLLEDFGKSSYQDVGDQHMKVYLRIRPFADKELQNNEDKECLVVETSRSVVTHAPEESHSYKNCAHGLGKITNKFSFSKIFEEETTQKEFFNEAMLGLVKDFIDGQNCLVFTYGVTSSGKTYTVQGEPKDAGILPRTLDVLFNSISGKQWERMNLKPKMFTDVVKLSSVEEEAELSKKELTLKLSSQEDQDVMDLLGDDASDISQVSTTTNTTVNSDVSGISLKESLDSEPENRIREETALSVSEQGQVRFSVWVSFAEIHNEQIFDLLQPISKKKNVRRPVLKLSDDKSGSPFIKGLKEICVFNADEAYKLLTIGQRNLQTACTKLNHQSSRSHCIFNIKVIRVVDKGDPNMARVSMLSLCDLAGSERQSKTQSVGHRLKEAGNINTSLMTLGRCIEMLRNKQLHRDNPKVIPFRDSKLTRIFQNFFCGQGKANMIVNVNKCASMFDETLHVLKFSAIASQVIIQKPPTKFIVPKVKPTTCKPSARLPSIAWATPGQVSLMNSKSETAAAISLPDGSDDEGEGENDYKNTVNELVKLVSQLEEKLRNEVRARMQDEMRIREEVCNEMMKQLVQVEGDYSKREREIEVDAEERMEKRLEILMDGINAYPEEKRKLSVQLLQDEKWRDKIKDSKADELREMLEEAGHMYHKKEIELKHYKEEICEKKQTIDELEKALQESRLAMERADEKIFCLNEKIVNLESERMILQGKENNWKEEVEDLKAKIQREESESLSREQALINGYKAEMSQLKKQILELKTERRHWSPCKSNNAHEKLESTEKLLTLEEKIKNLEVCLAKKDTQLVELNDELSKINVTKEMMEEDLQDLIRERESSDADSNKEMISQLYFLKEHNEELTSQMKHLEKEASEQREQNKELSDKVESLTVQITDLKCINEALSCKAENLQQDLGKEKNEVVKMEHQFVELNDKLSQLNVKKEMMEEDIQDLIKERESLRKLNETNKEAMSQLDQLKEDKENLTSQIKCLELEASQQKDQNEELTGKVESLTTNVTNLKVVNKELNSKVDYLEKDLLKEKNEVVKMECINMESDELKNENKELSIKVENLSIKVTEIEVINEELKNEVAKMEKIKTESDDLRSENSEMGIKVENLSKKATELKDHNEELSSKIENLLCDLSKERNKVDKMEGMRIESDELKSENKELGIKVENLSLKLMELNDTNNELSSKVENLQQNLLKEKDEADRLERIKNESDNLKSKNKELVCKVENLQDEVSQLRDCNDEFVVKIEHLQGEISKSKLEVLKEREQEKVEDQTASINALEGIVDSLNKQISNMYQDHEELKDSLIKQTDRCVKQEETLKTLERDLADKNDTLTKTSLQLTELEEKNKVNELRYEEFVGHMNDLTQEDFRRLSTELEDREKNMIQLTKSYESLKDMRNSGLQGPQLSKAKLEVKQFQKFLQMHHALLENTKSETSSVRKRFKHIQKSDEDMEVMQMLESKENTITNLKKMLQEKEDLVEELNERLIDMDSSVIHVDQSKTQCINKEQWIQNLEKEISLLNSEEICEKILTERKLKNDLEEEVKNLDNIILSLKNELRHEKDRNIQVLNQNREEHNVCKTIESDQEGDKPLYHQSERSMSEKSDKTGQLNEELSKCHMRIKNLEKQLQDSNPMETKATLSEELCQSQNREMVLKQQLREASNNISELNTKICELEDKLQSTTQALENQKDMPLKNGSRTSLLPSAEREKFQQQLHESWKTIQSLQEDLQQKDERIKADNSQLRQLKNNLENDHNRYEAALKDASANEAVIDHIKEALAEQEDTMSKQDIIIQQQEDEIKKLKHDLETYMNQYSDSLSRSNTSAREIRNLNIQNARLCADKERLELRIEESQTEKKQLEANILEMKGKLKALEYLKQTKPLEDSNVNQQNIEPRHKTDQRKRKSSFSKAVSECETEAKKHIVRDTEDCLHSEDTENVPQSSSLDVTPPVVARQTRRKQKKRSSVDLHRNLLLKENRSSRSSTRKNSLKKLGSAISVIQKSLTGKKELGEINEDMSPGQVVNSPVLEVADSGTQMTESLHPMISRQKGKRHILYSESQQLTEDACKLESVLEKQTNEDDVHSIVRRKLRGRKN